MDTEKPEYFDRYFDEEDDKKQPPKPETEKKEEHSLPDMDEREYFDESLFTEESVPDQTPSTPDAIAGVESELPKEFVPTEKPKSPEEPKPQRVESELSKTRPEPKPEVSEYDYEDSKIQGINWKPLLIWSTVFIAVIVIVFFVYTWFFAGGTEEAVTSDQTPVISAQEQMRLELEKKKIDFVNNIIAEKKAKLTNFSNISDLKTSTVSYSSILLYGNTFNFEIFGQTRDDIAKYNQNIKRNKFDNNFKILSVDNRPGSNGGVFALYSASINPGGGASKQSNASIDPNIQNTIQNLMNSNGLKIKGDRIVSRKKIDQFEVIRKEIICSGTEASCAKFLNSLNSTNSNFNVHKISMVASNQKTIKNSAYNLLLIIDFYI
jgi:hypothetical protein